MLTFKQTFRFLFVLTLLLGHNHLGRCPIFAQDYSEPPIGPGQTYMDPLGEWQDIREGDLRGLPDGYYLTELRQQTYFIRMYLVKKGDSFISSGEIYFKTSITDICAEGEFRNTQILFDEMIQIQAVKASSGHPYYRFVRNVTDFPRLDVKEHSSRFTRFRMSFFDKKGISSCTEALPLISNRLRVTDSQIKEKWNITGALEESIIHVIPADEPASKSVMDMQVMTGQSNEFSNGRFSSKNVIKGSEDNLVDGKSYFLRAELYYRDNITVNNTDTYLLQTTGCNAPAKMIRSVVRDSKPFLIRKGYLRKLVSDIWPWDRGHDTSTPSGKALFDRDVAQYNRAIDQEITRIMSQPSNIDFPPPIVLVHGIRSCYADWNLWVDALGDRHSASGGQGSQMAGLITFTPAYDYSVKGKYRTTDALKKLRDKMGMNVLSQIERNLAELLAKDTDTPPEVYLIAHSNGGVVARPISKLKGASWRIRKIYTLGSPHSGTLFPFGSEDYGLSEKQMPAFNCLEGGFPPGTDILAIAGNAKTEWLVVVRPLREPTASYIKSLVGTGHLNDGIVYPQGSTYVILCQKSPTEPFTIIQSFPVHEYPLCHSNNWAAGCSPNFLDQGGIKMFEAIIARDMGLD